MWHLLRTAVWSLGVLLSAAVAPFAAQVAGAGPSMVLAAAVVVSLVLAVAVAANVIALVPASASGTVHIGRRVFRPVIDQCDPDAAGRPRPRAPGRRRFGAGAAG